MLRRMAQPCCGRSRGGAGGRDAMKRAMLSWNSMLRIVAIGAVLAMGLPRPALADATPPDGSARRADDGRASTAKPETDKPAPRLTVEEICRTLAQAAADNGVPEELFTRLIWQESRFDPAAISPAGAQGIAQFMPGTAAARGLGDAFEPLDALRESAGYLR